MMDQNLSRDTISYMSRTSADVSLQLARPYWLYINRLSVLSPSSTYASCNNYNIEVLSGFPVDTTSKKTHPDYRQTYKWSNSDLVSIGRDNCLYANSWSSLSRVISAKYGIRPTLI